MTAAASPLDASSATAESGRNDATTATNESRVLNDKLYGSITKATDYETWEEQNVIMQEFSYYTIMNELSNIGIKDKIFMDVGCGPCPIGQKLVVKGAKKVFGVDISQAMLDRAQMILEGRVLLISLSWFKEIFWRIHLRSMKKSMLWLHHMSFQRLFPTRKSLLSSSLAARIG